MRAVALCALLFARPDSDDTLRLLDFPGRACLDPIRWQGLRPPELIERLRIAPDATVADVGAGPGFLTAPLASALPGGHLIATDVRDDYLAVANMRASRARIPLETHRSSQNSPDLAPGSIDVALLVQVDHYLPDRAAYFSKVATALRPGGRIALVNYLRYREADRAAAAQANLRTVDEWQPTPPFFLLVLAK